MSKITNLSDSKLRQYCNRNVDTKTFPDDTVTEFIYTALQRSQFPIVFMMGNQKQAIDTAKKIYDFGVSGLPKAPYKVESTQNRGYLVNDLTNLTKYTLACSIPLSLTSKHPNSIMFHNIQSGKTVFSDDNNSNDNSNNLQNDIDLQSDDNHPIDGGRSDNDLNDNDLDITGENIINCHIDECGRLYTPRHRLVDINIPTLVKNLLLEIKYTLLAM